MQEFTRTPARSGNKAVVVRPALVTAIACLELAAALWDGRIFLKLDSIFPLSWGDNFSFGVLVPAVMCIVAIFAGVGLLQMRRSAWAVWMVRHGLLGGLYLLSLPGLMARSMFYPELSVVVTWRLMIVVFSLFAGAYLYAVRGKFGANRS